MSFSRHIQWYHSHADPIWPDGTFKGTVAWFWKFNILKILEYTVHLAQRSACTLRNNSKGFDVVKCLILCIQNNADAMSYKLDLHVSKIMQLKQKGF
jgi:hypothetical protein